MHKALLFPVGHTPEPSPSSPVATALPQEASAVLAQAPRGYSFPDPLPQPCFRSGSQPHQASGAGTQHSRCGAAFAGTGNRKRAGRSSGSTSAAAPVLGLWRRAACCGVGWRERPAEPCWKARWGSMRWVAKGMVGNLARFRSDPALVSELRLLTNYCLPCRMLEPRAAKPLSGWWPELRNVLS